MPKRQRISMKTENAKPSGEVAPSKFLGFLLLFFGMITIILSLLIGLYIIARPYHLGPLIVVFSDTGFSIAAVLLIIIGFFCLCYYISKFGKL